MSNGKGMADISYENRLPRTISIEIAQEMVRLYNLGHSVTYIAKKFGVGKKGVRRALRFLGAMPRQEE